MKKEQVILRSDMLSCHGINLIRRSHLKIKSIFQ